MQDGERTVASAKSAYQMMIVLVPMAFAFAAVLRPDLGPRPRQPEIRRLAAWAAAAALIWAAMPMAALLTLPVTG